MLGAGIISAVMGSDAHQVLAMSTMFTKDIYTPLRRPGKIRRKVARFISRAAFIVVVTVIAYCVALYLKAKQGIFEIAIRFAFSGFAAMAPVMIAALFWKRSTKWGALASTLFVAATLITFACLQGKPAVPPVAVKPPAVAKNDGHESVIGSITTHQSPPTTDEAGTPPIDRRHRQCRPDERQRDCLRKARAPRQVGRPLQLPSRRRKPKMDIIWKVGDHVVLSRAPATGDVRFWNSSPNPAGGYMTVVPMVFGSALCMIIFSLLTRPPSRETIDKYFSEHQSRNPK